MHRTPPTLLGVLLVTLLGIGCASGPRPMAWDRLPLQANSDSHGLKNEPAVMDGSDLLLKGQDVRTHKTYVAPVSIECDMVLDGDATNESRFAVSFLPAEQSLDAASHQFTKVQITHGTASDSKSINTLEILDSRDRTKGRFLEGAPVFHLKINVLAKGELKISVNGIDSGVPDILPLPYRSFQIELGGGQPTNYLRVRNFSVD